MGKKPISLFPIQNDFPKVHRPDKEQLKKLYSSQCSPCICDSEQCSEEDRRNAKKWRCGKFCSGLTIFSR